MQAACTEADALVVVGLAGPVGTDGTKDEGIRVKHSLRLVWGKIGRLPACVGPLRFTGVLSGIRLLHCRYIASSLDS